ncbi:hypothetical protein GPECTOR_1g800 [Gonium pectorale]|uniref:Uncharacterized protein n=1 Tax=Gonium pectorale TaxID=33097 RepID=A0A150H4W5_GONPE|nr:hypothetical protein GPECTOR_1g800 [Gonium pectorale]|eukprot:KXZ56888.1 hypothetical protein GPECTOR_1g800 [Gonium pectorale]
MAGCINGGEKGQFSNLDGTESMTQPGTHTGGSSGRRWCSILGGGLAAIYLLLLTAVAVIAFILGIYSTDKVRNLSNADAVLVADPRASPGSGYSVFPLGTGLGYWSPTADMQHSRSDHGVIAVDKYAYLIGGVSDEGVNGTAKVLTSVVRYDTETGFMEEMEPLPDARYRFAYAKLGNYIYVIGGTNSSANDAGPLATVMMYDINRNRWSYSGKLNTPRIDPCGAAINNKVYVFGGYDETFASLASTEELDPATATATAAPLWKLLPGSANLTTSRGDCRAVAVDDKIYAVGGVEFYINPKLSCKDELWINCYRFLSSVEAFDPVSKTWSARASMISPRGDFGIDALPDGRILVAGGERGNGVHNQMAMYDVEEYVAADDVWVQKGPLPQARFRTDMAFVSGRAYAFGGVPSCGISDDPADACHAIALKSVFAYFDVQYPRLYAFYRTANGSAAPGAASVGRRMLA